MREFQEQFNALASGLFGSGWTWLVKSRRGDFEIKNFRDSESPLLTDAIPLLTCDVWEHAYYIDYKNERKTYLANFWTFVNWWRLEHLMSIDEDVLKNKTNLYAKLAIVKNQSQTNLEMRSVL